MTKFNTAEWPELNFADWEETCSALHLWCQIIGKYRLRHTFWVNHSWHATLYVTSRGLTTGPIPDPNAPATVTLDFCDHQLVVEAAGGQKISFALEPMSVAEFYRKFKDAIERIGGDCEIHRAPNELPDPVFFDVDDLQRPYDTEAVQRFHSALLRVHDVFTQFRTGFLGKVSPAHLFWGSFDLAVTRFSGRLAPEHPGGIPYLPDAVTWDAYSHEVSSAGFWPGNGYGEAMFYSYAYPTPDAMKATTAQPDGAFWHAELGEFLLPYEAVRTAADPSETLMMFLQSTYDIAASTGNWDRAVLDRPMGKRGTPN